MAVLTLGEQIERLKFAAQARARGEDPTPFLADIKMPVKVEASPEVIKSVDLIAAKIKEYFNQCDENNKVPTEFKLSKVLGVSVDTLHDWADGVKDVEYQEIIADAYTELSDRYIQLAATDKRSTIGTFLLKQKRFGGYTDRSDTRSDATVKIIHDSSVETSDFQ